jgi:hypothetical protein
MVLELQKSYKVGNGELQSIDIKGMLLPTSILSGSSHLFE